MTDLMERKALEQDRLTLAIANGYVLSMSAEAQAAWRAEHSKPAEHSAEEIAAQSARIARLASYGWHGPSPIRRRPAPVN